jgi:hypothetical protein
MSPHERKQFLDIVQQFKLATEANRESLALKYTSIVQKQMNENQPITSVLGFCMEEAGNSEKADQMFNYVLAKSPMSYWPNPALTESVVKNRKLKTACYKHGIIPIKLTQHLVILCGSNPHDAEGITAICEALAIEEQYPIYVLSEPAKITKALTQFN